MDYKSLSKLICLQRWYFVNCDMLTMLVCCQMWYAYDAVMLSNVICLRCCYVVECDMLTMLVCCHMWYAYNACILSNVICLHNVDCEYFAVQTTPEMFLFDCFHRLVLATVYAFYILQGDCYYNTNKPETWCRSYQWQFVFEPGSRYAFTFQLSSPWAIYWCYI